MCCAVSSYIGTSYRVKGLLGCSKIVVNSMFEALKKCDRYSVLADNRSFQRIFVIKILLPTPLQNLL